ncbi:permease-like cell division protein FtsX [bacterium]|nr:permease-like cell division protein FtsX [bacterium]
MSTFIIIIATSLITGLFIFRGLTDSFVESLKEKVDISVYFSLDASEEEIMKVKEELAKIPEVREIQYVSREEALNRFREKHKDNPVIIESLNEIGDNPLAAHLNIKAAQASQYEAISKFLEESAFAGIIDKIDYYQNKAIINKLFSINSTIQKISLIFILVSSVLAILVAFNMVRLSVVSFKKEISIMRLVGASNWFIRGPFMMQGAISGLVAALVSLLLFTGICYYLSPKIAILIPGFSLFDYFYANLQTIVLLQLACGLGLGTVPVLFAIRKYLKV